MSLRPLRAPAPTPAGRGLGSHSTQEGVLAATGRRSSSPAAAAALEPGARGCPVAWLPRAGSTPALQLAHQLPGPR